MACLAQRHGVRISTAARIQHSHVLEARYTAASTAEKHERRVARFRECAARLGFLVSFPVSEALLRAFLSSRVNAPASTRVLPSTASKDVDAVRMAYHQLRSSRLHALWGPPPSLPAAWEKGANRVYDAPDVAKRPLSAAELSSFIRFLDRARSLQHEQWIIALGFCFGGVMRIGGVESLWVDTCDNGVRVDFSPVHGLFVDVVVSKEKNLKPGKRRSLVVPDCMQAVPNLRLASRVQRWVAGARHSKGFLLSLYDKDPRRKCTSWNQLNAAMQRFLRDDGVATTSVRKCVSDLLFENGASREVLQKMGFWTKDSSAAEAYFGIKPAVRMSWLRSLRQPG